MIYGQPDGQHSDGLPKLGETCAAYRFLSNSDVEWQDIMAPQ
jgi:hypothetical protein